MFREIVLETLLVGAQTWLTWGQANAGGYTQFVIAEDVQMQYAAGQLRFCE